MRLKIISKGTGLRSLVLESDDGVTVDLSEYMSAFVIRDDPRSFSRVELTLIGRGPMTGRSDSEIVIPLSRPAPSTTASEAARVAGVRGMRPSDWQEAEAEADWWARQQRPGGEL